MTLTFSRLNISKHERKVFNLHLLYSFFEGIISGILLLNEIIYIKSLDGPNTLLAVLFQASVVLFIFSVLINEIVRRVKNKKRLLILTGIITRAPLFLLLLFPHGKLPADSEMLYHTVYLVIFFIFYFANPIIWPIINTLLKGNYSHQNFGKLFSYATSLKKLIVIAATFVFGIVLDNDNFSYVYILPFMGLCGILSVIFLTVIPYKGKVDIGKKESYYKLLKDSFTRMVSIIKSNKPYRDFEVGFMMYGLAFMLSKAIIDIFMVRQLNLSYIDIAFYKNLYHILAIVTLPFYGKLIGRIDPRRFAVITYASMIIYIVFLGASEYFSLSFELFGLKMVYLLFPAFIGFGIFTATMALQFSIGSSYFCTTEEAGDYQSIHLTLVGFRATVSPLLGVLVYELFGYTSVFAIAAIALFIGIWVMYRSMNKHDLPILK